MFKKISAGLLAALLLAALIQPAWGLSLDFQPRTGSLLLVDMDTGEEIYSQDADVPRPMASTTKIMTYIITAEAVDDLAGTEMEILAEPLKELKGRGASVAGLEELVGQSMPVLDVLYGLMLPSGCDAAAELAWFVGEGDMQSFVDRMNEKARELGCTDTHFADSHGLSDQNRSTARDMYKIAACALEEPMFWEVVNSTHYTMAGTSIPIFSSVRIQDPVNGGRYYYQYAHGIKTGFTYAAGRCLISTAQKGETRYLCVALGGEYSKATNYANFAMLDSASLYEWAFDNFTDNIKLDIPRRFASVQLGDTLRLTAEVTSNDTDQLPEISWSSSAPEIASVDQNGLVTAHALGEAVIRAESQTGNFDDCTVSCGYYNGIDVSSQYGDYSGGEKAPIDWGAVGAAGLDFAFIRAGWRDGDGVLQADPDLNANAAGAAAANLAVGLSFTAGAANAAQAAEEGEYVLQLLRQLPDDPSGALSLPVFYDMSGDLYRGQTAEENTAIALAFQSALVRQNVRAGCYAPRGVFVNMDTAALREAGMPLWYRSWPYVTDFTVPATVDGKHIPEVWQYRSDQYLPQASEENRTKQSLVYMASAFAAQRPAPEVTAVQNGEEEAVALSWTAPGWDCDGYRVYRRTGDGIPELLAELDASAESYIDAEAAFGQEYVYTVAALARGDLLDPDYVWEAAGESEAVRPAAPNPLAALFSGEVPVGLILAPAGAAAAVLAAAVALRRRRR